MREGLIPRSQHTAEKTKFLPRGLTLDRSSMPVSSRFVHPLDQEALQRSRVVFSLGTIAALFCLLFRAGTEIPQDGQRSQWASLLSAVVVLLLGPPILSAFASGLEHLSLRQWRQRQSECLDYLGLSLAAGLLALMIWFVLPLPATATVLVGLLHTSGFIVAVFLIVYGGAFFSVPILRLCHAHFHLRKISIGLMAVFAAVVFLLALRYLPGTLGLDWRTTQSGPGAPTKTYLVLAGGFSVLSLFLALFRTHDRIRQISSFLQNSAHYFSRLPIAELTHKLCETRGARCLAFLSLAYAISLVLIALSPVLGLVTGSGPGWLFEAGKKMLPFASYSRWMSCTESWWEGLLEAPKGGGVRTLLTVCLFFFGYCTFAAFPIVPFFGFFKVVTGRAQPGLPGATFQDFARLVRQPSEEIKMAGPGWIVKSDRAQPDAWAGPTLGTIRFFQAMTGYVIGACAFVTISLLVSGLRGLLKLTAGLLYRFSLFDLILVITLPTTIHSFVLSLLEW